MDIYAIEDFEFILPLLSFLERQNLYFYLYKERNYVKTEHI